MKKILFFILILSFFVCSHTKAQINNNSKRTTEFQPVVMTPDLVKQWAEFWYTGIVPNIVFDYVSQDGARSFLVIKNKTNSIVLFNYNKKTYLIPGGKVLSSEWDYSEKLFPDIYAAEGINSKIRENKLNYFHYLKVEFQSKEIIVLSHDSFSANFKK